MADKDIWKQLTTDLTAQRVTLVAVSKRKSADDIRELYDVGQRDFGENYVQELQEKEAALPKDIRWHFIGHLQSNKVKDIAPFVHLIHSVDRYKLLEEINKHALKNNRTIDVLLQIYIAKEETKFGLDEQELDSALIAYNSNKPRFSNIRICGVMGMATNTDNVEQVYGEYKKLHTIFERIAATWFNDAAHFSICSMGMSADYKIALQAGSNMVRIGSMLFGKRVYTG